MVSFGNARRGAPVNLGILSTKGSLYVTRRRSPRTSRAAPTGEALERPVQRGQVGQGEDRDDEEYRLADAAQAHRDLEDGRRRIGGADP